MNDEEKRRLRAIQDEVRRTGDPVDAEGIGALFNRLKSIATAGRVDPKLQEQQELAAALAKWRRP